MVWFLNAAIVAGVFHDRVVTVAVAGALLARAVYSRRALAWAWLVVALACWVVGYAGVTRIRDDATRAARIASSRGGVPMHLEGRVVSFPQAGRFGSSFLFDTDLGGRRVRLWVRGAFYDVGYGDRLNMRVRLRVSTADERLLSSEAAGSARARLRDTVWLARGGIGDGPQYLLWRWHRSLRGCFSRAMSDDAALPLALLLGERGFLKARLREAVVRLGIAHLLALSGMHLGAIAMLALPLSRAAPRGRDAILFGLLSAYVGIVGEVASLERAYIMAALMLLARVAARPVRPLDALGKALFLMLLASPASILSVGLQLSFAATLVVLAVVTRMPSHRNHSRSSRGLLLRLARWLGAAMLVSLAVEVVIAPLQLYHFGRISVVGPVATALFVVPVTVLHLASLLAGACGLVAAAAAPLAALSTGLGQALLWASSRVPAPIPAPAPNALLYYAAVLLAWRSPRRPLAWVVAVLLLWISFPLP